MEQLSLHTRKASSLLLQPDPGGLPSVQWALAFVAKVTAGWSLGLKLREFGISDLSNDWNMVRHLGLSQV